MRSFFRTIKYAFQDVFRNFWLSVITVTIMLLALLSINFLIVLNTVSQLAVDTLEEKIDISVYFEHDVNDNQVYEIESMLLSLPQTESVTLVSKENALEAFLAKHEQDSSIVDAVQELESNPLGVTLVVKAQSSGDYPAILKVLDEEKFKPLIKETSFQEHEAIIERITVINQRVKNIGLVVSAIFTFISLIVIFNTIRITIYTHREAIQIMKLVGANNWFVKAPYLWQAIIFSAIAVACALVLTYPFVEWMQPFIHDALQSPDINLIDYFSQDIWKIFGIEFVLASLFSVVSSNIATRKYLDV